MGRAPLYQPILTSRLTLPCIVIFTCASLTGALWAAEKPKAPPTPRFSNGTPGLRPFDHKPGHGVHPNKFNDGGELTVQEVAPKAPKKGQAADSPGFNPDPGGVTPDPMWATAPAGTPDATSPTANSPLAAGLFPDSIYPGAEYTPLLTDDLELPRRKVQGQVPLRRTWEYPDYYQHDAGYGRWNNSQPVRNRWDLTVPHWQRYMDPSHETPYMYDTPRLWHPYEQSILKGDVPILGTQDIFLNVTAKNFSLFEKRKLPTPAGVSTAAYGAYDFFGRSESIQASNDTSIAIDLFEGETAFKPVHWLVRVLGVYNTNWIRVKETGAGTNPDPRGTNYNDAYGPVDTDAIGAFPSNGSDYGPDTTFENGGFVGFDHDINPADVFNHIHDQLQPVGEGDYLVEVDGNGRPIGKRRGHDNNKDFNGIRHTTRHRDFFALQEAFAEIHISDITDNYDFVSSRFGIQPFVSDFRGFVFADTNLGVRIFGNYDNNRLQYNLAYFNQREKDTYSDLNTFDSRHQQILIANLFKQDFFFKGYTALWSFHANWDDGGTHYDKNGFLMRPTILGSVADDFAFHGFDGTLRGKDVKSFYLGWGGDGHIGRLNLTHQFYYVFGEDEFNSLAGRKTDISAFMAAAELSYDRDWIRLKASGFYASGDSDPTDRTATGFDSITDHPFFIGGPFSWYVHQGFNLGGTGVNFKQRDSLIPNLRTSKNEGQSNFVNPGVAIVGLGTDIEVTPKLRAFANANYIWMAQTEPIALALQTNRVRNELGLDLSLGFRFRPLLTENIIFQTGIGVFMPGPGYRDIYRQNTDNVPGYGSQQEGKVDRYLYNAFATLTLIY
jgi:hypothetical protein